MHSIERLIRILEDAPVSPFSGFCYRVVADRYRDSPLSSTGSLRAGGRYNAPNTFPVLYCADSQMTAMLEVEALFMTDAGELRGAPRNPDLVLSIRCELIRVLDLTAADLLTELGTSFDELVSLTPSRFILNARGQETPTQRLGAACSFSGKISALKVPSAVYAGGFCIDLFPDSLLAGESASVLDESGRISAEIRGVIPSPTKRAIF